MVAFPPPINTVLLPFLIALPFCNPEKINRICMLIGYLIYATVVFLSFVFINIIFLPITYIKILVEIIFFSGDKPGVN